MKMKRPCTVWLILVLLPATGTSGAETKFDSSVFGSMEARAIGPAVMGGRIAALDVVKRGKLIVYVGAASGGVWKSLNGGTTFKPVFDKHTQSIGAIAIDRKNPDVVWVGTGEPWTRNSVSVGTGVYKTTDGGENWQALGLKDSERITKIVIDPTSSETVYVCATGHLWNANEERGVFKTADGGKTWEKVLYVDADTGCGDLAIDPQEPGILYAGMWQFRRWPWTFNSGGPGSGLYKSTDAGKTWRKITRGLPAGNLGRIAVAVAPSRPSTVYATVEAEKTAMYRSDDLGETWRWVGTNAQVESRPFYFSLLVVDPKDHRRVYKPATMLGCSTDGGETFTTLGGGTHADHHAFWIDPDDTNHFLLGTDGGLYESNDRGGNWEFLRALPISQFYHVAFDMEDPYNVYGGLQDNGTWYGPSRTPSGIQNKHWNNIGFGDGFAAWVDPQDKDIVFVEWQGGRIQRTRKSTGETKDVKPFPGPADPKLRFNWNTPIHGSLNRKDTLYIGSQFLYRSRDRGESWERISPDLTTNDPNKQKQIESGGITPDNSTAENHCTIFTIGETPKNEKTIWVGTDDGNVQLTRDGGSTWTNVVAQIPGLPPNTWVSHLEPSRHTEGACYATFDGHRTGDMKSYVYKTTDDGRTWTSLATDSVEGYCHVIREDPVNPKLLFLGTEFGLFISIDGGTQWARFEGKVPKVGVFDMLIHPREHDLILGTHGRGILILDDITPLRKLTPELLDADVAVLDSRRAIQRIPASVQEFSGDDQFVGANPPDGAQIAYYLKKRQMFGDLKIEIVDHDGKTLAVLPAAKRRGLNRVNWSMRMKPPKVPPAASLVPQPFSFFGPSVAEGAYAARLTDGKTAHEAKITIIQDPRATYTVEDKTLQDRTVLRLYDDLGRLTYVVDALLDVQKQARDRKEKAKTAAGLEVGLQQFDDELEGFRKSLVATRKGGFLAGDEQLREKLGDLYGAINAFEGRPTNSQLKFADVLEKQIADAEAGLNSLFDKHLETLNRSLREKNLEPLKPMTRQDWEAKEEKN